MDPAKGWLHNGELRISAKVIVSSELKHGEKICPGPSELSLLADLSDSFRKLMQSTETTDVTILVCDTKIEAHSLVLMARSPVFATMLSCGLREASTKDIVISDLDADAMRELVSFLYTGCVPPRLLEDDHLSFELMKAAHRFECQAVVDCCATALAGRLTASSVAPVFETADLLGCAKLRQACLEYVHSNAAAVLEARSYSELLARGSSVSMDMVKALAVPPAKRSRTA